MFDSNKARALAVTIAGICTAAVAYAPDNVDPILVAISSLATALVTFFGKPPTSSGAAVGTLALCLAIVGCGASGTRPPTFLDAVNALDAQHVDEGHRTAVAVCVLAQTYRGEVSQAEALTGLCANEQYLKVYADEALYLRSVVLAHRNARAVPERCPPAAVPSAESAPADPAPSAPAP